MSCFSCVYVNNVDSCIEICCSSTNHNILRLRHLIFGKKERHFEVELVVNDQEWGGVCTCIYITICGYSRKFLVLGSTVYFKCIVM